jgi:Uma2 family endonuclease
MYLTVEDLEKLQAQNPDLRMELVEGKIIVMSPSGYESEEVGSRFLTFMNTWVIPRKIGRVAGSNAGFNVPDLGVRAPDVSFVLAERLRRAPKSFAQLIPDLMVEVKSPTDKLKELEEKIASFLRLGTKVGILINPETRTVQICRSGEASITLRDGDVLTVPELLPGWEIPVTDLWSPEFE